MNAARIGVLVLAVVAAGLAALLARGLMGPSKVEEPQVAQPASMEILVASTDIQPGQRLASQNLRWQSWPAGSVPPNFITRAQQPEAVTTLTSTLARQPITNGEPVTMAKIIDPKNGGLMSALISPGMRAVAVPISPETSAGGFILPNDRVDVLLTRKVEEKTETGNEEVVRGETILVNIRVLAIDQSFKTDGDASVAVGKTATLELTNLQAESLAIAQAQGTVSMALRGLGESETAVADKPKDDNGNVVRVVRYGSERTVRVR